MKDFLQVDGRTKAIVTAQLTLVHLDRCCSEIGGEVAYKWMTESVLLVSYATLRFPSHLRHLSRPNDKHITLSLGAGALWRWTQSMEKKQPPFHPQPQHDISPSATEDPTSSSFPAGSSPNARQSMMRRPGHSALGQQGDKMIRIATSKRDRMEVPEVKDMT
jgi:hypothetical protein